MAKKLKDYYGTACARLWADKLGSIIPRFPKDEFVTYIQRQIRGKEFLARQDVYADAFERFLRADYSENLRLFSQLLGPKLRESHGMFREGWWLWPVGRYVERHGERDWSASLAFISELTQRFTGEFAIRPLLERKPRPTLVRLIAWSQDESPHVRRLASEGVRPRLPWARQSRVALEHPDLYRTILSNLRQDPDRFVQKSVGNNLNDLAQVAPNLARQIIAEWREQSLTPATEWIIRHGERRGRRRPASQDHSKRRARMI